MIELNIQHFTLAQADEAILQRLSDGLYASRIIFEVSASIPDIVEVTFETPGTTTSTIEALHALLGKPITTLIVPLPSSLLSNHSTASSNVLEHAFNWFPVSKITPEFQRQIESDFSKLNDSLVGEVQRKSVTTGWSHEFEHPELGEKARAFAVFVDWQSLDGFLEVMQKDSFKAAIPILFAWKAPYRIWLTQRIGSSTA